MQFREPTPAELSFSDYFHEVVGLERKAPSAEFYVKCAEFLAANVQENDDVSNPRHSVEDLMLNFIDRHPHPGRENAYEQFLAACEASFSPSMRARIQSDPATRLKREIVFQIHQKPEPQVVRHLVQRIHDVAVEHGEVSSYVVGGWLPAPESPFMDLLDCLPKDEQVEMKAKLLEAVRVPDVLNHMLFHTFCLRESKRNPSGTNLLKRGKLTEDEGLAIIASGRFAPFMVQLVDPERKDLERALDKVRASSYGQDAFFGHFKQSEPEPAP